MTVGINNHVYTAAPDVFSGMDNSKVASVSSKPVQIPAAAPQAPAVDTAQFTTQPKKKRGFFGSINNFISNCKKLGAGIAEFAKGTAKGIAGGAVVGGSVLGIGKIADMAKKHGLKNAAIAEATKNLPEGQILTKEARNAIKERFKGQKMSKLYPALAILAGLATLGINIWKSKLNYNERRSDLEHRYEEPHLNY